MRQIRLLTITMLAVGSLILLPVGSGSARIYKEDDTATLPQIGEKVLAVIQTKRTESLKGYLLVICRAPLWKSLEKDSDIGPFLSLKTGAKDLDAVLAMPAKAKDGITYCVYLKERRPIGFASIRTDRGEAINDKNAARAYNDLTEDYPTKGTVSFEDGIVHSDDDQPIPTLIVIDDGRK